MHDDDLMMSDLHDAIIEDTCHCDLCGGSFVLGGNGEYVIVDTLEFGPGRPDRGALGGQLKLCEDCARRVHDAYRENLREAGICEHGTSDGDYCEDCNREYKRARRNAEEGLP